MVFCWVGLPSCSFRTFVKIWSRFGSHLYWHHCMHSAPPTFHFSTKSAQLFISGAALATVGLCQPLLLSMTYSLLKPGLMFQKGRKGRCWPNAWWTLTAVVSGITGPERQQIPAGLLFAHMKTATQSYAVWDLIDQQGHFRWWLGELHPSKTGSFPPLAEPAIKNRVKMNNWTKEWPWWYCTLHTTETWNTFQGDPADLKRLFSQYTVWGDLWCLEWARIWATSVHNGCIHALGQYWSSNPLTPFILHSLWAENMWNKPTKSPT